jgi:hypothetical protein
MITNVNNTSEAELDEDSSDNGPQPTIIAASERKLQSFSEQKVEGESGADSRDTGYRFVDLQAFQDYGQSFVFHMQCSKCNKNTFLQTSKSSGMSWQPKDAMDINRRLVYAASETGIGREGTGNYM